MICHGITSMDLEVWGSSLTAPLQGRRYPISTSFEVTNRCNLNCQHCFINEAANNEAIRQSELSTTEIKEVIDQMVDAGMLFLTLTGGEPLLRADFVEIYTYARTKGLLVILFTNGTMITQEIADLLGEIRPFSVDISLYGATQAVYEAVTRQPGSFAKCISGIERILDQGIPLALKSELMTVNVDELPGMVALAEYYGVSFRYDGLLWPRLDGTNQFPLAIQLPIDVLVGFDTTDEKRRASVIKEMDRLAGLKNRDERIFSCGAGLRDFHLDSQGRMSLCTMVRKPSFSLREIPLIEAWGRLGDQRKLKRTQPSPCTTCTMNSFCAHCPGWSQAIFDDNESVVEFVCAYGQRRSMNAQEVIKFKIVEVIEHYD
jgi:radical SAM protein with 4Fe4S-binding SPASM domain